MSTQMLASTPEPEAGAQCISSARWDLCEGCRVTGIPIATRRPRKTLGYATPKEVFFGKSFGRKIAIQG